MGNTTFQVRKDSLGTTRLVEEADTPLRPGQICVEIDKFAFTSNNVTYAAAGDFMKYWQFYPSGQEGWGVIPVWGFGTVMHSMHDGIAQGERLYGYWPMASQAVLTPTKVNGGGFLEGAPHRQALHAVYNAYMRAGQDPFYTADSEDLQALMRPLFLTSFLIDDFLADNAFFGARTLLLSSASSKTAYGTAHQLFKRPGMDVVGLTSESNRAFCESLGCYHRVLSYEQLDQLPADTPCVYIDFAGNAHLRAQIHTRFTRLTYSSAIGVTHVTAFGPAKNLPGPAPVQFFAPAQIKKRQSEVGPGEFGKSMVKNWLAFYQHLTASTPPWLEVERHQGAAAVQQVYAQVLAGRGGACTGHILSFKNGV